MVDKKDDIVKIAAQIEGVMQMFGVAARVVEALQEKDKIRYIVRPAKGGAVSEILDLKNHLSIVIAARRIQMEVLTEKSCIAVDIYPIERKVRLDSDELSDRKHIPNDASELQDLIQTLVDTDAALSFDESQWHDVLTLVQAAAEQDYEVHIRKDDTEAARFGLKLSGKTKRETGLA